MLGVTVYPKEHPHATSNTTKESPLKCGQRIDERSTPISVSQDEVFTAAMDWETEILRQDMCLVVGEVHFQKDCRNEVFNPGYVFEDDDIILDYKTHTGPRHDIHHGWVFPCEPVAHIGVSNAWKTRYVNLYADHSALILVSFASATVDVHSAICLQQRQNALDYFMRML